MPDINQLGRVDPVITALAQGFMNDEEDSFIAPRVFAPVFVDEQNGQYHFFPAQHFMKSAMGPRAHGGEPIRTDYAVQLKNYNCTPEYVAHDIDDDQRRGTTRDSFSLDNAALRQLTSDRMIRQDIKFQDAFMKTGVWAKDRAGVSSGPTGTQFLQWNQATSNPVKQIKEESRAISLVSGRKPNTLVLGAESWGALSENSVILGRIEQSQLGIVTQQLVAQMMEIERIVVATGSHDTGNDADSSETMARIVTEDTALLVYANRSPDANTLVASGGYQLVWKHPDSVVAGSPAQVAASFIRIDHRYVDRYVVGDATCPVVTAPAMGTFFSNVV